MGEFEFEVTPPGIEPTTASNGPTDTAGTAPDVSGEDVSGKDFDPDVSLSPGARITARVSRNGAEILAMSGVVSGRTTPGSTIMPRSRNVVLNAQTSYPLPAPTADAPAARRAWGTGLASCVSRSTRSRRRPGRGPSSTRRWTSGARGPTRSAFPLAFRSTAAKGAKKHRTVKKHRTKRSVPRRLSTPSSASPRSSRGRNRRRGCSRRYRGAGSRTTTCTG